MFVSVGVEPVSELVAAVRLELESVSVLVAAVNELVAPVRLEEA